MAAKPPGDTMVTASASGCDARPSFASAQSELDNDGEDAAEETPPVNLAEYTDWGMKLAGQDGPLQFRYNVILASTWAYGAMQTMASVFTAMPESRRRLCGPTNLDCHSDIIDDNECKFSRTEYEYIGSSLVGEFDLVCDRSLYVALLGTLLFLGFLVGAYAFGAYADKRGRRAAFLLAWLSIQIGGFVSIIAPSYRTYAFSRVFVGFGLGGFGLTAYVWNAEFLGPDGRSILVFTTNMYFAAGMLCLPAFSLLLPKWRHFSVVVWLFGCLFYFVYVLCLESPKWLATQGKASEVHKVLNEVAKFNGKPMIPAPIAQSAEKERSAPGTGKKNDDPTQNALRLVLCDSRFSTRFIAMCVAWFCLSLGYYGLSMNASNIGSSVYVSSAISSLVEFPAYVVAVRSCEWESVGRKGSTAGGLVIGGLCCVLSVFALSDDPDSNSFVMLFLVFFGKFAIALSFATVYLYAAELFPTSIRTRAMGWQSLSSRAGGMLSSLVASLGQTSRVLPLIIFGVPCLIIGVLMFLVLPETRGQAMMDTVEDMPKVSKGMPKVSRGKHLVGKAHMHPSGKRRYDELEEARRPSFTRPAPDQLGCSPKYAAQD